MAKKKAVFDKIGDEVIIHYNGNINKRGLGIVEDDIEEFRQVVESIIFESLQVAPAAEDIDIEVVGGPDGYRLQFNYATVS